ncbi:hypothetical protein ACP26L_07755 [Paenibacillus sp. S-38]|uniref:hypothetical protein n=1 Tax=Paenibacillus sp. S-38 TaxID=3416710 RepID=UPI003CE981F3
MRIRKKDFKITALEIVRIFEISIEHVGFPYSKRTLIDGFYESKFDEVGESIKKRIMNLEYNFFGSTNFKERNAPQNEVLFKGLSAELDIIKEELEKYPENN